MTARLDKTRPMGKITPPMEVGGCDRPAMYEQDGKLFCAHGMECTPDALAPAVATEPVKVEKPAEEAPMSVEALLRDGPSMPYAKLAKHAKAILGPTCPSGKQPIIDALSAAKTAFEARQAERKTAKVVEPEKAPEPAVAAAAPAKATGGVDLAAWGRGQKDYLFGEVQKALRTAYHVQLSERRAAVEFLIEQKVISAQQARRDV